ICELVDLETRCKSSSDPARAFESRVSSSNLLLFFGIFCSSFKAIGSGRMNRLVLSSKADRRFGSLIAAVEIPDLIELTSDPPPTALISDSRRLASDAWWCILVSSQDL